MRILADEQRRHVIPEVAHHRQFAPVERGVAQARVALVRSDLEGYEIAVRAGDDDFGLEIFTSVILRELSCSLKYTSPVPDHDASRPCGDVLQWLRVPSPLCLFDQLAGRY